jgi:hypothetical protein
MPGQIADELPSDAGGALEFSSSAAWEKGHYAGKKKRFGQQPGPPTRRGEITPLVTKKMPARCLFSGRKPVRGRRLLNLTAIR